METKLRVIIIAIPAVIVIGSLLYFFYKHLYEYHINQQLQSMHKNKWLLPAQFIKVYIIISIITVFIMGFTLPTDKKEKLCELIFSIHPIETDEHVIQKALYDDLQGSGQQSYSYKTQRIDEHLTAIFANNDTSFVYALKFELHREPLNEEVIVVNSNGAQSYIAASDLKDKAFYFLADGKLDSSCQAVTRPIQIYNFTKGENTDPIDIQEHFIIENGGIHR